MGSYTEAGIEEESQYVDARSDAVSFVSASSDLGSDIGEEFESTFKTNKWVSSNESYNMWIRSPQSVQERRDMFFSWLGVSSGNSLDVCGDFLEEVDTLTSESGAELRNLGFEDKVCVSKSSVSYTPNDASDPSDYSYLRDGCISKNEIISAGSDRGYNADEFRHSDARHSIDGESEETSGSSPMSWELSQRRDETGGGLVGNKKKVKRGWLSKLRSFTCIADEAAVKDSVRDSSVRRVQVHQNNKKLKELSALHMGQEIKAHEGSILTMKFSTDGRFLASAGEDGIVRLWQVVEDDTSNRANIPDLDPSCMYFTVNHLSELAPFSVDKERISKLKSLRKASDSACVIFPPKIFRVLEKPLHEFHGHSGEILDLAWSKNNCLLSASVDKTVRLWQVGNDQCLKVFSHSDYVTCVQFNPVDEDYFISGSIDGKVRIWAIPSFQVVDWNDIKDIVTAVCYRPDVQGVIVGSIRGSCRFYSLSDNHLQLDSQIYLQSKKKSLSKRITSFQKFIKSNLRFPFLPQDPSKVMVTSADSQVRILDGANVIGKYKGLRSSNNNIYASLTSDGKHIISASEDSNVYVWNCSDSEDPSVSHQTKNVRSCERFSTNASVAIPWCGIKNENSSENNWQVRVLNRNEPNSKLPFASPACFCLSQEFCLETFTRGTATWPEEKLPTSSPLSASSSYLRKSRYKFLRNSCKSTSNKHAWGLVIVTAGWDGRIRSFHNYGLPVPT